MELDNVLAVPEPVLAPMKVSVYFILFISVLPFTRTTAPLGHFQHLDQSEVSSRHQQLMPCWCRDSSLYGRIQTISQDLILAPTAV